MEDVFSYFEKPKDPIRFNAIKISIASPDKILSWSFGEVKKPETINYRTYRPEKDGLFCERIFGPERDWECACGKYKGTKHRGIICDRCGVKVTHSRVRRKRMGHINLAAPVVHIWFFKALPSRLGTLLDMKTADLEKIILFQNYVVTDQGQTPLKYQQVLSEDEYRSAYDKYRDDFKAQMGAEAVRTMLQKLDLNTVTAELREDLKKTTSKQRVKDLSKRLKLVESIRTSGRHGSVAAEDGGNKAQWMNEMNSTLASGRYPDLKLLTYFDINKEEMWSAASSSASLSAFLSWVKQPYMNGRGSDLAQVAGQYKGTTTTTATTSTSTASSVRSAQHRSTPDSHTRRSGRRRARTSAARLTTTRLSRASWSGCTTGRPGASSGRTIRRGWRLTF